MCEDCNIAKGNHIPKNVKEQQLQPRKEIKAVNINDENDVLYFADLEKASKYVCSNLRNILRNGKAKSHEVMCNTIKATIRLNIAIEGKKDYCGYRWERI